MSRSNIGFDNKNTVISKETRAVNKRKVQIMFYYFSILFKTRHRQYFGVASLAGTCCGKRPTSACRKGTWL